MHSRAQAEPSPHSPKRNGMLVNAVMYTFAAEEIGEAERTLRELRDKSRAEAGCITFDVSRSVEDENVFVLYEEWQDQAALDFHYKTEHFERLGLNGIRKLAKGRIGHRCLPIG
jgi:quinol monooxygenase YgiN